MKDLRFAQEAWTLTIPGAERGGRHVVTASVRGICIVRNLRNYRVRCHRSVSPRCATHTHGRRYAKDFVANGPAPGYVTLLVEATIEAGVKVARHTHPGIESSYVLEGGLELPIEGQPTRTIKAGDGFQIPAETPHAGGKPSDVKSKILITYVVKKGKPLASPA